ncbi:MAG TPA: Fic family protein [Candidatus Acidoferrales bacterium]|nr:Fic family protein [Candidatus Acidoferrales bacterium]
MVWNWQQPDWPTFTWDRHRLEAAEQQFLVSGGVLVGTAKHLGNEERDQLAVEAMTTEALTTSEIEGEILDRASVQSSVRRQLGLKTDARRVRPAEQGIAEMMVDLYRSFAEPLSPEMLFRWHRTVMAGRRDLKNIGRYRTDTEPMQVVSGAIHAPRVHLEAPPSSQVDSEMARFFVWFHRTGPRGEESLPALTRAGTAHLYFESIHPFEDGNGRIGRAIAEKSWAESLGQPTLTALATTILARRKSYYEVLEAANKQNEITTWLAWFAGVSIEAQHRTIALVEFLIDKAKLLDRLRGHLNERQEKTLLRMFREGPEGFEGGLTARKYSTITRTSPATVTRDLADLVEKGALVRAGERRHARYDLAVPLRPVKQVKVNERGELVES